jgi:hypothetical protein
LHVRTLPQHAVCRATQGKHIHEAYTGDRTKEALEKFAEELVASAGAPMAHKDLEHAPHAAGCNVAGAARAPLAGWLGVSRVRAAAKACGLVCRARARAAARARGRRHAHFHGLHPEGAPPRRCRCTHCKLRHAPTPCAQALCW